LAGARPLLTFQTSSRHHCCAGIILKPAEGN